MTFQSKPKYAVTENEQRINFYQIKFGYFKMKLNPCSFLAVT